MQSRHWFQAAGCSDAVALVDYLVAVGLPGPYTGPPPSRCVCSMAVVCSAPAFARPRLSAPFGRPCLAGPAVVGASRGGRLWGARGVLRCCRLCCARARSCPASCTVCGRSVLPSTCDGAARPAAGLDASRFALLSAPSGRGGSASATSTGCKKLSRACYAYTSISL